LYYGARLGQEPRPGTQAHAKVLPVVERRLWRSALVTCWSVLLFQLDFYKSQELHGFNFWGRSFLED